MTQGQISSNPDLELERIRAEHRRRSKELPADLYGWQRPVNQFWYTQLSRAVLSALVRKHRFPLEDLAILDVGCGEGLWLVAFLNWGARPDHIRGIDLSPERIEKAKARLAGLDLRAGDAGQLPWPDGCFDIVSGFTVFSSILDSGLKARVALEMRRVLKPEGIILWYDFFINNPKNPNVRGVKAGEVRSLFPHCRVELRRVTLAPPIARCVVPISWTAAVLLDDLPFLRSHYFGVIEPV